MISTIALKVVFFSGWVFMVSFVTFLVAWCVGL